MIILSIVSFLGVIAWYKVYNKQHRSVEDAVSVKVSANQLFKAFETDETKANEAYLDKVVEVTGIVSEVWINQAGEPVLLLKSDEQLYGVSCTMKSNPEGIVPGVSVTVKGICTGYLSDVVITQGLMK
jgi:hypothetical protein